MSSANKTDYLALNVWASSDSPKRADFNSDNYIIDTAFEEHAENTTLHTSDGEKEKWNTPTFAGSYYGNGDSEREIETGCDFEPTCAVVFGDNMPLAVTSFDNGINSNYFGVATTSAGTAGLAISGANLVVTQSSASSVEDEYTALNEAGVTYNYILFR